MSDPFSDRDYKMLIHGPDTSDWALANWAVNMDPKLRAEMIANREAEPEPPEPVEPPVERPIFVERSVPGRYGGVERIHDNGIEDPVTTRPVALEETLQAAIDLVEGKCGCGCGELVKGGRRYVNLTHRSRALKRRQRQRNVA